MNSCQLIGYAVAEPNVNRVETGGKKYVFAEFTLAIPKIYKKQGEVNANFIRIKTANKQAEFIEKYLTKGRLVAVTGSLESDAYTLKSGLRQYTTKVFATTVSFLDGYKDGKNVETGEYSVTNVDLSGLEAAEFQTGQTE